MLESAVRSFHVYRGAWTPVVGEELTAEGEPGNSEDPFAVRLKRGEETVGYVPREISNICWLFIHRGSLTTEVTHCAKWRSPILQGDLEIPCVLRFKGSLKNIEKLVAVLNKLYGKQKATVLDIKRVENAFFHSKYIFSVILHAIDKQDIST